MHIGIITHNYPSAGGKKDAGILIWEIAHAMAKTTHVSVLTTGAAVKQRHDPVDTTRIGFFGSNKPLGHWGIFNPLSLLAFTSLLYSGTNTGREWVTEDHIDVIIAMWAIPAGLIAYRLHKQLGIPYAVVALGSDIHIYSHIPIVKNLVRQSLQAADVRIANSHFLCREVTKLTRLPCQWIPTATAFPLNKITPIALHKKKYQFLFVGRLEKVKGIDILLEACIALRKKFSAFELQIIGDGTLRPKLEERIKNLSLESTIHMHGPLNQQSVAGYLKAADCLVIPSRQESLPLIFLEAAKSGLPIITSDVGDSGYVTQKYHTGLRFPSEDVGQLVLAMTKMMRMKNKAKSLFKPGLRQIAAGYNPSLASSMLLAAVRNTFR